MRGFLNVLFREIRRIFTQKDLLLICFVAPLVYTVVLSSVYLNRRVTEVPIGLVDQDQTQASRTLIRWLTASQNVKIVDRYENVSEANDDLKTDGISGLLMIPRGFSNHVKKGQTAHLLASVNSSNIIVANPVLASFVETANSLSSERFIQILRKSGAVRDRALSLAQPLRVNIQNVFNPRLNYSDFFIPGLILMILQQIILVGLGFSVSEERQYHRGSELLSLCQGNRFALLAGKLLPYVLLNFFLGCLLLSLTLPAFGLSMPASGPALLLLLAFVVALTLFGLLVSAFFKDVPTALICLMFYSMPAFLVSGYAWPDFALPVSLRALSMLFPCSFFLRDFRMVILGNTGLADLAGTLAYLAGFSALCFTGAFILFSRLLRERTQP